MGAFGKRFLARMHTAVKVRHFRANYIIVRATKFQLCFSKACHRFQKSLLRLATVFFLQSTPSFPQSLALASFLSVFILYSSPSKSSLLCYIFYLHAFFYRYFISSFVHQDMHLHLFLLFHIFLTSSLFKCLRIY